MTQDSDVRMLQRDDVVFRVIEPEFLSGDPASPEILAVKADAFEDRHSLNPETLSLFVERYASPVDALNALSSAGV